MNTGEILSAHNENVRLEAFSDGVFAIAITLLIIEIKVPHHDVVHSSSDLWRALGHLWPSFLAYGLGFGIILGAWVNHHNSFKLIDKSSPAFLYANGFLLLTIAFLPFPVGLLAEYIATEHASPAVIFFQAAILLNGISWFAFAYAQVHPKPLAKSAAAHAVLLDGKKLIPIVFVIDITILVVAVWFPMVSLALTAVLFALINVLGVVMPARGASEA